MKNFNQFANTSRVSELETTITNTLGGVRSNNFEPIEEYLFEMYRCGEYDKDDIKFVCEHLFVDPVTNALYVLEVQEQYDGTDALVIEVL